MRSFRKYCFITIILASAFYGLHRARNAFAGNNLISHLLPSQSMVVRFHSQGCFHFYHFDIHIQRSLRFSATLTPIKTTHYATEKPRIPLQTVVLTPEDVANLDKLLTQYRASSMSTGSCTTETSATFVWDNWLWSFSEHFLDNGCEANDDVLFKIVDAAGANAY